MRPLRIVLVGFLAIETVISVKWFIPPPTLFLALATLAFAASLVLMRRSAPAVI